MPTKLRIPAREITAYRFDELDDNAKDTVREWLSDGPFVTDNVADSMQYELEKTFDEVEISEWDLDNGSDGISFSGQLIDQKETLAEAFVKLYSDSTARHLLAVHCTQDLQISVSFCAYRGSRTPATHASVTVYEPHFGIRKEAEHLEDDLEDYFHEFVLAKIEDALSEGRKDLEYHYSDEYIKDLCEANSYLFDEHGNFIEEDDFEIVGENA